MSAPSFLGFLLPFCKSTSPRPRWESLWLQWVRSLKDISFGSRVEVGLQDHVWRGPPSLCALHSYGEVTGFQRCREDARSLPSSFSPRPSPVLLDFVHSSDPQPAQPCCPLAFLQKALGHTCGLIEISPTPSLICLC